MMLGDEYVWLGDSLRRRQSDSLRHHPRGGCAGESGEPEDSEPRRSLGSTFRRVRARLGRAGGRTRVQAVIAADSD